MILEKRIPLWYWLKGIIWDLCIVLVLSVVIYFFKEYVDDQDIPIQIGAFLGTAITLLLSFKLAQSYDRWWEARKIWGAIVNDCRSLVVQLKSFTGNVQHKLVHNMAYRQIAWCYSLSQRLRKQNQLENIENFISSQELLELSKQDHAPLCLLDYQSRYLSNIHKEKLLNDFQHVQIDSTLVRLCASMGQAERIKNTVFPKTYRVVLHLFIYIFLILLSLSLTELINYIEIPLLVLISIPFFLLEKIAFTIQDPFENTPTDTAMTAISRAIEINIKELLDEELPEPLSTKKYYMN